MNMRAISASEILGGEIFVERLQYRKFSDEVI
jgi:hypothetical protein